MNNAKSYSFDIQRNDARGSKALESLAADYLLAVRIWESAGIPVGEASPEFADSHSGSGGNISVMLAEQR